MIDTKRLSIYIATDDEMRELIDAEENEEMKKAYGEMLAESIQHPEQRQWYAIWFIKLKSGEKIGSLCFKGITSKKSVEIGYGIIPNFWGKGYATEAVKAMATWALQQPEIEAVEAEVESGNIASRRVLEKVGFKATGKLGEEGSVFTIESEK